MFCDITAIQFLRMPPCLFALVQESLDLSVSRDRRMLYRQESFLGYLNVPLHILVTDRARRHQMTAYAQHLWSDRLPPQAFVEIGAYHMVTSPLFTLLMMAPRLSHAHLAMLMYELCGTFSAIKLKPEHRAQLQSMIDAGTLPIGDSWRPVLDQNGKLTDLWQRNPLVTLDELRAFAEETAGMRGHKAFARAAKAVLGITASPFEAQTVMLLGACRRQGGEGFGPMALNEILRYDASARSLTSQDYCRPDILFPEDSHHGAFAIECQGAVVHGNDGATEKDADRVTALQSMGIPTILLTYEQIANERRYHQFVRLVAKHLGIAYREKTPALMERERDLRRNVLIDWTTLGM